MAVFGISRVRFQDELRTTKTHAACDQVTQKVHGRLIRAHMVQCARTGPRKSPSPRPGLIHSAAHSIKSSRADARPGALPRLQALCQLRQERSHQHPQCIACQTGGAARGQCGRCSGAGPRA